MKIGEIEAGSAVTLLVKKDDLSVELPSEIVKVYDDSVLTKCFMHGDNLVSFDVDGLSVEMMVVKPGEVPYNFKNVQVSLVELEGVRYHCLRTGTVGVKLNRRNAFRVFIGEDGSAIELGGGKSARILVKDLSSTGIGFLVDKTEHTEFEVGTKVHVTFADSVIGKRIEADSMVVRAVEQETQFLYGCMFTKHYPDIERYTASKQVRKGANNRKTPPKR